MPNSVPLSVVIITFNEERNIGRCLASVRGIADEIVVVDSFSTDRTGEICQQYGATFLRHPFAGHIQQKNYALSQATHPYVLSLDADEALSPQLQASVRAAKSHWAADAYEMARLTNYCGHWVRHGGWYPDRKLRLYDRRLGRWTGLLLHERYEVAPGQTTGQLAGDALHYSYHSIAQHVSQLNKFTSITAQELALRRKTNVSLFHLLLKPLWKFVHGYVFRLGWLDGFAGLCIASISAWGVFLKFAKLKTRTESAEA